MHTFLDGVHEAQRLILSGDEQVVTITLRTLRVAFEATAIAVAVGLPLGAALGLRRFRGRGAALSVVNAGLRLPPVALGQILWLMMWPDSRWGGGPLAGLDWLYTLNAVILAQALLAIPIVAALTSAAVQGVRVELLEQAQALGASAWRCALLALREARTGIVAGVVAALGTAISTVGAIVIVGNSLGSMTLATAALVSWNAGGDDVRAVAYGLVLLGLFLVIAAVLTALQHQRRTWIPGRLS